MKYSNPPSFLWKKNQNFFFQYNMQKIEITTSSFIWPIKNTWFLLAASHNMIAFSLRRLYNYMYKERKLSEPKLYSYNRQEIECEFESTNIHVLNMSRRYLHWIRMYIVLSISILQNCSQLKEIDVWHENTATTKFYNFWWYQ